MSVCIEQINYARNYQHNHNNDSQHLPIANTDQKPLSFCLPQMTMFSLIKLWVARSKQRKHLASLDENLLKDIGITPSQAFEEYSKPFWK